jgi:hypothetical protein
MADRRLSAPSPPAARGGYAACEAAAGGVPKRGRIGADTGAAVGSRSGGSGPRRPTWATRRLDWRAATRRWPSSAYYSSYGTPAPLAANSRPVSVSTNDGIGTLPFALAHEGALIVGIVATSGFHVLHSRRRAGQPL